MKQPRSESDKGDASTKYADPYNRLKDSIDAAEARAYSDKQGGFERMAKFSTWRPVIANLRMPDPDVFSSHGAMRNLAKSFDSYPINLEGARLCVLLTPGMPPLKASQLPDEQASSQVVVLKEESRRWVKVWPTHAHATSEYHHHHHHQQDDGASPPKDIPQGDLVFEDD